MEIYSNNLEFSKNVREEAEKLIRQTTQIVFFHEIPTAMTVAGATVVTACVVASGARHGCQIAIARFLECRHLVLQA